MPHPLNIKVELKKKKSLFLEEEEVGNFRLTAWLKRRYCRVVLSKMITSSVSEVPTFSKGMTALYQEGSLCH